MSHDQKQHLLREAQTFISEQLSWLKETLSSVGWNISELNKLAEQEQDEFVTCTVLSEHRIPVSSLEKHTEECEKKYGTYPELIDASLNYSDVPESSQSLRGHTEDVDSELSNSGKKRNDNSESTSTHLTELLIAERNAKRKRAAYRGKRVHSGKKSYCEILRELISNQMETLNTPETGDGVSDSNAPEGEHEKKPMELRNNTYLGVGDLYFDGNPYTRWRQIEKEEQELEERRRKRNENDSGREQKHEETCGRSKGYGDRKKDERHRSGTEDRSRYRDTSEYRKHSRTKDYKRRKSPESTSGSKVREEERKSQTKHSHSSQRKERKRKKSRHKSSSPDSPGKKRRRGDDADASDEKNRKHKKSKKKKKHKSDK